MQKYVWYSVNAALAGKMSCGKLYSNIWTISEMCWNNRIDLLLSPHNEQQRNAYPQTQYKILFNNNLAYVTVSARL